MTRTPSSRFLLSVLVAYAVLQAPIQAKTPNSSGKGVPSWKEIEQLISDQKYSAALEGAQARLAAARNGADEKEWTQALIKVVQLRTGLQGYESSVRILREQPWPKSVPAHAAVSLFYAHLLTTYAQEYSWEIREREKVESKGPVDLQAWTMEQIYVEANRTYLELWKKRSELGKIPPSSFGEYISPSNYPAHIRDTLRDVVTYFWVEQLVDSSAWLPQQFNELFRLPLSELIHGNPERTQKLDLADSSVHPLIRIGALLDDLEVWHTANSQYEGALEARLERLRRISASFTVDKERELIRKELQARLPSYRNVPWWSAGQSFLAELTRDSGDWAEAHRIARTCAEAYPESTGGRRCLNIQKSIAAPEFSLEAMSTDGPGKRSIQISHRNLSKLYFAAYPVDLEKRIASTKSDRLLPEKNEIHRMVISQTPEARWPIDLPATEDFQMHKTFVVPNLKRLGLYIVAATADPHWDVSKSPVMAAPILISDLVLITHAYNGLMEATVVMGESGDPVRTAEVTLIKFDEQRGYQPVDVKFTDAHGSVIFKADTQREQETYSLLAKKGQAVVFDSIRLHSRSRPSNSNAALVYTDRSIYRPLQKLFWKVVAYSRQEDQQRFKTLPNANLNISLRDPYGNAVETKPAITNEFGSAAGEFLIPSGRVLGSWRVVVEGEIGSATVRVEEYKRPTFEATFKDPETAMRLNKRASVAGEVKYYFGLPVPRGSVQWRVERKTEYPWWWSDWFDSPHYGGPQAIDSGAGQLAEDGTFRLTFTPEADERLAESNKDLTFLYSVTADITDEGGETRSASRTFRLGFSSITATIESAGFAREGIPFEVNFLKANLDGVPRSGNASWRLFALKQPDTTSLPADGPVLMRARDSKPAIRMETPGDAMQPRWAHQYSPQAMIRRWQDGPRVGHGNLEHDPKGRARVALPRLSPGAYRLRYQSIDEFGTAYETSKDFIVAGRRTPIALPVVLWAEKSSVKVGETARFLATSGFAGQRLTLEVFRGGDRVDVKYLTVGRSSSVIEIPVREEDRGGFSVYITTVRDFQLMDFERRVQVPWDNRELQVSFSTFRDKIRPGARESWRVTVRGNSKTRLETGTAELLAYMYDQALDLFAPHAPRSVPVPYLPHYLGLIQESLGRSSTELLEQSHFPELPPYPQLTGDSLKLFSSYGIGGPGVAGGFGARDGMMRRSAGSRVQASEIRVTGSRIRRVAAEEVESIPAPPPTPQKVELRQDFFETAFWRPQLLTDKEGSATIEFTVPDSVTSWNVWVHAVTKDLRGGSTHKQAKSVKELMVRPYVPRFLREGDQAAVKVVVNNASEKPLGGTVQLDIIDPETNASVLTSFSVSPKDAIRPLEVAPGKSANFTFDITAPKRVGAVAFKLIANAGDYSDGELRPIPILPSRLHMAQSRFATLHDKDKRVMKFDDLAKNDDPTRVNEKMLVTVDTQLFYSVLQSLPYLVNYPYECTEQTLNRFLSTGIVSSLYKDYPAVAVMAEKMSKRDMSLEIWDSADSNRRMALEETPWLASAKGGKDVGDAMVNVLDPRAARVERQASLAKLWKSQTSDGGFPWFPGGPPNPYMTLYLLLGFAKAAEFGIDVPKEVIQHAWEYLVADFREHWSQWQRDDCCWEHLTFINYVASSYPDASHTIGAFKPEERQQILDFSYKHWKQHSPYLKGYLALTLHRMGRHAAAMQVFDSVMDSAKSTPNEGTFWAPEDRSWLWYNDTIETHAFALRTLIELSPQDARRHGLVQWLLLNKKLNHWKSTRATAEVIYALVKYLQKEGALAIREDISVAVGDVKKSFVFEPDEYSGQKNQIVLQGMEINPKTTSVIEVDKISKGFAFASATWHFSTDQQPAEGRGDFFSISRRYFRRENKSQEVVLQPLIEGAKIQTGDEVEVQISIRATQAAEYVHLRDPRAAGLEPENAVSRFKGNLGIGWYEETRDSGTNFFFEHLPVGQYSFKYRLRASMAGTFRVGPATLQSMYAPEFNAYSTGANIRVGP